MKNVYKTVAIALFGIIMISAQGVEGQPRNKQSKNGDRVDRHEKFEKGHKKYKKGHKEVVRYDPGYQHRGHHGNHQVRVNNHRRDMGRGGYNNVGYGHHSSISYGQITMHHGQLFKMRHGLFYATYHGRWVETSAPIGLRVMRLPHGVRSSRTKYGPLYEFRGTYYIEARRGIGYVVTDAPHRGQRRGW